MNHWLNKHYAFESDDQTIEEAFANPEEITIVTDETTTEVEDELADLSAKIKDGNRELDQLLVASDAIVSTEAIMTSQLRLLTEGVQAGRLAYTVPVQRSLMAQAVTAFEAYGFNASYSDLITSDLSFEADEDGGGTAQAEKDAGKHEGLIRKLWGMLARAAKAVWNALLNLRNLFRKSNEANKKNTQIFQKEVAAISNSVPKKDKVKTSGFRSLVVGTSIDASGALDLVSTGYTKNLKETQAAIDRVVKHVSRLITSGAGPDFEKTLEKALGGKGGASEVLNHFLQDFPKDFKIDLPGGRNAVFTVTTKSAGNPNVSFTITAATAEAPAESPVLSKNELEALVEKLKSQYALVETINKELDANITMTESVLKNAEAAAEKATGSTDGLKSVIPAAQAVLNLSKALLPKYNDFAIDLSAAAIKYGRANVKAYGKGGDQ